VDSPNTSESAFSGNLNTYCHVLKDKYISLVLFPAGFATKWFVTQFCEVERLEAEKRDVSVFDVLAEKVAALADEPTYIYVTPHFVGSCNPHNDVRATGTIVGLTPFVDRIRMYKAVYEGIAYEFSIVTDVLEHNVGKLEMVRINGGGAKSNFTLALRSNVSGRTISRLTTNETVCLGAAMLSGIAVGIYRDYQDAVDQTVRVQDSVKPDKRIVELYRKPLQMYETIYRCLEPVRELSMT
jgi:xylulokinase